MDVHIQARDWRDDFFFFARERKKKIEIKNMILFA